MILAFDPAPCPEAEERARSLLSLPVRHMGRDHNGVDCAGVMRLQFAGRCEVPLPAHYPLNWFEKSPRLTLEIAAATWPAARGMVRAWDLLVLRLFTFCGEHPAAYLGGGRILHAYGGRVEISGLEERCRRVCWRDRVAAVFRPVISTRTA